MIEQEILKALDWRTHLHLLENTEAVRIFYGPGESEHPDLKHIAIDLYLDHIWITQWKEMNQKSLAEAVKILETHFKHNLKAIVLMDRSKVATDVEVKTVSGIASRESYSVTEYGVSYRVKMSDTKHPGLFLDHAPLRAWLRRTQKDKTVLNLFSYTGSLSVACGVAGASQVTTLDLSKPILEWAKENWTHAGLDLEKADFIYGDVFEWLPKFKKRNQVFDTILCDPPSFSRSKNGTFSTNKDSAKLHEQIFSLLKSGGVLVTSINSENYSERNFLEDITLAAEKTNTQFRVLSCVDLPETFPTASNLKERYLKGFYLLKN